MNQLQNIRKFLVSGIRLIAFVILFSLTGNTAYALDPNAETGVDGVELSIDEVARMIRQQKQWEILDAKPRQTGTIKKYRFKLLSNTGKVKVINVDPAKPNLEPLNQ